jgi:LPXTG-motif cell wall-anchored protein
MGVLVAWTGLFMHQTWVSALGALIGLGAAGFLWYNRRRSSGS